MSEKKKKPIKTREINCPRCKQKTLYHPKNAYRPFCSQRCQDGDFIDWSEERYQIPAEEDKTPEDDKKHEE